MNVVPSAAIWPYALGLVGAVAASRLAPVVSNYALMSGLGGPPRRVLSTVLMNPEFFALWLTPLPYFGAWVALTAPRKVTAAGRVLKLAGINFLILLAGFIVGAVSLGKLAGPAIVVGGLAFGKYLISVQRRAGWLDHASSRWHLVIGTLAGVWLVTTRSGGDIEFLVNKSWLPIAGLWSAAIKGLAVLGQPTQFILFHGPLWLLFAVHATMTWPAVRRAGVAPTTARAAGVITAAFLLCVAAHGRQTVSALLQGGVKEF